MTNEEIMTVVKPAICAQLKSPASAQFPVDVISIVGDDERGYRVDGFVDSQNSYGAMVRNDFAAEVKIENGFPVVQSSSVATKANVMRAKEFGKNYIAISLFVGIATILGTVILFAMASAMVHI